MLKPVTINKKFFIEIVDTMSPEIGADNFNQEEMFWFLVVSVGVCCCVKHDRFEANLHIIAPGAEILRTSRQHFMMAYGHL